MDAASLEYLKNLLNTPSPSGFEGPIQKVVREYVAPFAAEVQTDWHGNVIAAVNPEGSPRIMLDGHCDQIGLMVKNIDKRGFLWVAPVGGWDIQMLIGQNVQVWAKSGPIQGVIARKAIHLLTPEERKKVPEIKDLWIDIGAQCGDEARELIMIGDPVTIQLGYRELLNGQVAGVGMDDRVGVWVVTEALRQVSQQNPTAAVYTVSAVQEEIGLRGTKTSAFTVDPQLGIAVDVTHATDCPTIDENQHGQVKIGSGPVLYRGPNTNPVVFDRLTQLASENEIPIQPNAMSKAAANDGNALQINRGGVATGIVAIPNRYMHSPVEIVSLDDLQNAANLIAKFCLSLEADSDFTP